MQPTPKSPRITHLSWGRLEVEGQAKPLKEGKLFPGGAHEWDWNETGTRHVPGIQPADVEELLVDKYRGQHKVKSYSCLDQFYTMTFAQLTFRESLRDIEVCLRSQQNKLYHMGFRSIVARNTLANANEKRDWRIYAEFAQIIIHQARELYSDDDFGLGLENTVHAFDSTITQQTHPEATHFAAETPRVDPAGFSSKQFPG